MNFFCLNKLITLKSENESHSVMSGSLRLYSPWNSPGRTTRVGSLSLLQGIFPMQGSNPGLPHWRQILYQLSHQGKPKNTGVGSLSLLHWIFLTQESNRGLLRCRQILYQLSYQGNPTILKWSIKNNCSSKFSLKHSYYFFFIFANIQREMT